MVQVLAGERSQLAAGIGVGQRGLRRYVQVRGHLLAVRLNHFLRHAHALVLQLVQEALNLLPVVAQDGLFALVCLLDAAVQILQAFLIALLLNLIIAVGHRVVLVGEEHDVFRFRLVMPGIRGQIGGRLIDARAAGIDDHHAHAHGDDGFRLAVQAENQGLVDPAVSALAHRAGRGLGIRGEKLLLFIELIGVIAFPDLVPLDLVGVQLGKVDGLQRLHELSEQRGVKTDAAGIPQLRRHILLADHLEQGPAHIEVHQGHVGVFLAVIIIEIRRKVQEFQPGGGQIVLGKPQLFHSIDINAHAVGIE